MKRIFSLLIPMLALLALDARAFNSGEHQVMADRAFIIAIKMDKGYSEACLLNHEASDFCKDLGKLCSEKPDALNCQGLNQACLVDNQPSDECQGISSLFNASFNPTEMDSQFCDRNETAHYGQITCYVDYVLDPSVIFAGIYGNKAANQATTVGTTVVDPISDHRNYPVNIVDLNPNLVHISWDRWMESYARSSHTNDAHFQGQLMFNINDWHERALQLAHEQHLYAALVANAISDHYLQDFFAPGHIMTPRYNTSDQAAKTIHDYYNEKGIDFEITYKGNSVEWCKILRAIESNEAGAAALVADIHQSWCKTGEDESGAPSASDDPNWDGPRPTIPLFGDGYLDDHPDEMLFMTLVEVQSIREVLACYEDKDAPCSESKLTTYSWEPETVYNDNDDYTLRYDDNRDRCKAEKAKHVPPVAETGFGKYQVKCEDRATYDPTLSLTVGTQTLFADTHVYLKVMEPEVIYSNLFGSPDYMLDSHHPSAAAAQITNGGFGWVFVDSTSQYHANGPQARLIWVYPQIDLEASLYARYMDYLGPSHFWKTNYGLRLNLGFSYVTGYLQFGRDYGFYQDGIARRANVLQLGVAFEFPTPPWLMHTAEALNPSTW